MPLFLAPALALIIRLYPHCRKIVQPVETLDINPYYKIKIFKGTSTFCGGAYP